MKFNNEQAEREYNKLIRRLNYEDRQEIKILMAEITEKLNDRMLIDPLPEGDFHQEGAIIGLGEKDYAITVICWKCDSCDLVHIEISNVEEFVLN